MDKEKKQSNSLLNSLLAAICTSLLIFFSTHYLPWIYLLTPVAFTVLWGSEKKNWTFLSYGFSLAFSILLGLLFKQGAEGGNGEILTALALLAYPVLISLFMGQAIRKERDDFSTLVIAAFLFLGLFFLLMTISSRVEGMASIDDLHKYIEKEVTDAYTRMEAEISGGHDPAKDFALSVNVRNFINLIPALVFSTGLFFSIFNLWFSRNILYHSGSSSHSFTFSELGMSGQAGKGLLLTAVVIAIVFSLLNDGNYIPVRDNIISMINAIFMLDGLAILEFFFKRSRMPGFLRFILYLLMVGTPLFSIALPALSVVNIFADFRHHSKKEE